jgi:hypothetical protein
MAGDNRYSARHSELNPAFQIRHSNRHSDQDSDPHSQSAFRSGFQSAFRSDRAFQSGIPIGIRHCNRHSALQPACGIPTGIRHSNRHSAFQPAFGIRKLGTRHSPFFIGRGA